MALTTLQKLNIASISEYLSHVDIQKKGLNGGGVPLDLPQKIYTIRKSIAYWYALDPSDTTLTATGNYLMALCGLYGLEAQQITVGSGSVATITGLSTTPLPYDFIVSGSSFIVTGATSKTITAFIGYNIQFSRGGIVQNTTDVGDGSTYYGWDRNTGTFVLSAAAGVGELFRIIAV